MDAGRARSRTFWRHDVLLGGSHGFVGDRLERERNGLRIRLEFRHRDRTLPLETAALRRAYPDATPKLVVEAPGTLPDTAA